MGEYAIRKSDGAQIKIGTCEMMYYLRFEDRHKVRALVPNNVDPVLEAPELKFRLPYPDEDAVLPGDYTDYARGYRLWKKTGMGHCQDFEDPDTVKDPGIIQLTHKSGLLLNVPCYHGHKLPDVATPMTAFWNGKSWSLELAWLRPAEYNVVGGKVSVFPVVQCRHCGHLWRYTWYDIWDYIADEKLRERLQVYRGNNIEL
jgi:hypothetical protein